MPLSAAVHNKLIDEVTEKMVREVWGDGAGPIELLVVMESLMVSLIGSTLPVAVHDKAVDHIAKQVKERLKLYETEVQGNG